MLKIKSNERGRARNMVRDSGNRRVSHDCRSTHTTRHEKREKLRAAMIVPRVKFPGVVDVEHDWLYENVFSRRNVRGTGCFHVTVCFARRCGHKSAERTCVYESREKKKVADNKSSTRRGLRSSWSVTSVVFITILQSPRLRAVYCITVNDRNVVNEISSSALSNLTGFIYF